MTIRQIAGIVFLCIVFCPMIFVIFAAVVAEVLARFGIGVFAERDEVDLVTPDPDSDEWTNAEGREPPPWMKYSVQ
jgi:hypothetical protein